MAARVVLGPRARAVARLATQCVLGAIACASVPSSAWSADELSGADKLRALYTAEFRFTRDGVPMVPVAVAEGLESVSLQGTGLRLLPEGEEGPEITADDGWQIRTRDAVPARLRYWTIVWKGRAGQRSEATAEQAVWKARGEQARLFEQGTVFAVSGEVLDRRELLVAIGPARSFDEADRATERLEKHAALAARGVYAELVERPHGILEAVGTRSGIRVKNEGVLWFASTTDAPIRIDGIGRVKGQVASGSYHGRVYVTFDRNGGLAVVNAVPEDRLLAGLLPVEMFPNAPDEALKAQAVAARGQLLTKIGTRHFGDPYRLCARTHCQVYGGAGRETARATAAVRATRGEVLFTSDGKDLVDTVYSANCGGHTENNENVWPDMTPSSTLRGIADAVDARQASTRPAPGSSPEALEAFLTGPPRSWSGVSRLGAGERFRWTVTRSRDELAKLLAPLAIGELRAIEVLRRGVSGRALAVRLVGSTKAETIRGELRIRQTFGNLRSSLFVVTMQDGAATFRGAGFGHGVGMCQTGAMGMAEADKSYRQILQHYYTGSVVRKLW